MAANLPKLDKTAFSVASLFELSDEKQFWLSKTPYERLRAVEAMRKIIYGYDPSANRLQRVLKLLNERRVEYLLIGGYAVGYHNDDFRGKF